MINTILNIIILIGIIVNYAYTKRLEGRLNALKSWIEVFWKIDFEAMADFVEKEERRNDDDIQI